MDRDLSKALSTLQGFQALTSQGLEEVARYTTVRVMRNGETIFCQGEPSPYFFGVLSGEVTIQRVSNDNRFPKKVLGVVGPGGLFGESAIFEDHPRAALASASQDGELLVIRAPDIRQWLKKNPESSQPLLFSLLQTSLGRLHRTSHELSVVYGVSRLLGSTRSFPDQLAATMDFLKGSLEGLDNIVFYQRNAYWDEFEPVKSLPVLEDLPSVSIDNEIFHNVAKLGVPFRFDPRAYLSSLELFHLDWQSHAVAVAIPLLDWEKGTNPFQGLLLLSSAKNPAAFSAEKQLLLTSVAHPFAEALGRQRRIEESQAQVRLQKSRESFQS